VVKRLLELNQLYNMDCMIGMKQFPDKYFELAIVDPPYGIKISKMNFVTSGAKLIGKAKRNDYRGQGLWDDSPPPKEYFDELFRVSKNQIIWGGNYFTNNLNPTKSWIIWDKRVQEKYSNDFADCELAWCSSGVARVFRYLYNGMLQKDMKNKEKRTHPTQKPVALYKWLLTNYAHKGDKILDTHMGSGSEEIACYDMGFEYIGFEIDKDYFEKAQERIEAVKAQVRF
jgi:site-specific DNA-methyltransferase (adenine-specific)